MRVVPQKSDRRSHHGPAEYAQLRDLRHALQFQISCESRVPAHVGENRQRPGRDHRASNRQPIKPIGQIHRIAGSHNHQRHERHKRQERHRPKLRMMLQRPDHQVGMKLLQEGHDQLGGVHTIGLHRDQQRRYHDAGRDLQA